MERRRFITLVGGAAAAWPLGAHAQEAGRMYRLGVLVPTPRESPNPAAFFDELRGLGFVEGQNLKIVAGSFRLRNEGVPEAVAAIANSSPDVVFSSGGDSFLRAAQKAIPAVPIVGFSADMVAAGVVKSLARPGGNITGVSLLTSETDGKRQDILMEAVPGARRMAILADPTHTAPAQLQTVQDAARARGVELAIFTTRTPEEISPTMDQIKAVGAAAINLLGGPMFAANRGLLIERTTALRLPAIFELPEAADEGLLIGYGPRFSSVYRQAARMVAKVLRGTNPAEIPVEQPTIFELVINLKTAKMIGHEVPVGLLLRADKVIE
jgi:putative ABC transport system substrate-binding protein